MSNLLQIGISGLKASQAALTVTGHNITNASTEGYSRQVLKQSANTPHGSAGYWVGSGVNVDTVSRVYDKFLNTQLWKDTSVYNHFDVLATSAGQIDSLLADSGTGIQPGLEKMFGALQVVADNPASLAAREVLISESQGLIDRFSLIDERLKTQTGMVNGQLKAMAEEVTQIARAIAELNKEIQMARGSAAGNEPNDLFDRRDQLVKELSAIVQVKVIEQGDGSWNISIGNGQPLVTGIDYNALVAKDSSTDANRYELFVSTGRGDQMVSSKMVGGKMGGTLEYRETVLDPVRNELGRLALVITDTFNEQHKQGLDYDGRKGVNYFTDINDVSKIYGRVLGGIGNSNSPDRLIAVNITDTNKLTASDYRLEFPGPNNFSYRIIRESDGKEMSSGALDGSWPNTIDVEGFEIRVDAGTFKAGDTFTVTPTRNGASEMGMNVTRGEQVAAASPVVSDSSIGNRGNAKMSQPVMYNANTSYFSKEGELSPPLIVVFTSPTTYDVLDNSDPGNPIPLFPPLMNQKFIPGVSNSVLPGATGKTAFSSYGGFLSPNPTVQLPPPAVQVTPGNGFAAERFGIIHTDPVTGKVTKQPLVSTEANASAKEIAAEINKRHGVQASARTTLEISDFSKDPSSFLEMGFTLNGILLTDGGLGYDQVKYDPSYPEEVPNPITPDFLADRINANFEFQNMGIVAKSDGEKLTIIALDGEDLTLELTGDDTNSFAIGNGQEVELKQTGQAPFVPLNEIDGYDFRKGGPYTYEFDIPGQGSFSIELKESYANGDDLIAGINAKLEEAGFVFAGDLNVSISDRGAISFQPKVGMNAPGINGSTKMTMGGELKVVAEPGYSLEIQPPGNNLFPTNPVHETVDFGFEVTIDGVPEVGDSFTIGYNTNGTSDSRNASMLAALQDKNTLNDNASYSDTYGIMVERVGSITSRAQINRNSAEILLQHSEGAVSSLSGVSLDEEAGALIRFELAYNASAQVIQVARSIFDTLISTFR